MWPFRSPEAASWRRELNQLVTRVERLELDHAERQVAVMEVCEKVLHQLRAREGKRKRDAERAVEENGEETSLQDAPGPPIPRVPYSRYLRTMRGF